MAVNATEFPPPAIRRQPQNILGRLASLPRILLQRFNTPRVIPSETISLPTKIVETPLAQVATPVPKTEPALPQKPQLPRAERRRLKEDAYLKWKQSGDSQDRPVPKKSPTITDTQTPEVASSADRKSKPQTFRFNLKTGNWEEAIGTSAESLSPVLERPFGFLEHRGLKPSICSEWEKTSLSVEISPQQLLWLSKNCRVELDRMVIQPT